MRWLGIRVGLTVGIICFSAEALAGDVMLAETLFRQGKELMDAGDYAGAEKKLDESYRQDPSSGTILALALCQEKLGKTASAWGSYTAAALRARQDGRGDREQAATDRAAALEPTLSRLGIEVPPEVASMPGLMVRKDGEVVPSAAWNSALPVDPGEVVIQVSADGKETFEITMRMGEGGDRKSLVVPTLAEGRRSPVGASPDRPAQLEPSRDAGEADSSGGPWKTVGLVAAGAGVVTLGVGGFFAIRAKGLDSDSEADGHCGTTGCDDRGYELNQDALSAARLATVLVVVGGVLGVGGASLYLLSPQPTETGLTVSPLVAGGGFGLTLRGRL
jgi:hypothetical protein